MTGSRGAGGFTLVELVVVMAITALCASMFFFALGDGSDAALDAEADRLGALLEVARTEARVGGVPVVWEATPQGYRFVPPLPDGPADHAWRAPGIQADVATLTLGTEPVMAASRLTLTLGGRARVLATDGVSPFEVAGS